MTGDVVPVKAGQTARQDFSGAELQVRDTAAVAVAAQAKAAVEARYLLALKKPREWEEVRVKLERECKRAGFADAAWYRKPIGKGVEGPSIRFAEAALRCMTNCFPETCIIYEGETQRIIQVSVTDLESNLTYSSQIVIDKTVERRQPKDGQEVLGSRTNSTGDTVYLIRATEDELLNKQNALISKALRTNALRLLPGDIMDRCEDLIKATKRNEIKEDPDAAKRKLVDAFDSIGVGPADLTAWLGHSLDRIQPQEIIDLRATYTAIRDGEATWDAVMESRGSSGAKELQQDARDKAAQRHGFANAQAAAEAAKKAQEQTEKAADPEPTTETVNHGTAPIDDPARLPDDKPSGKPLQFGRRPAK